MPERAVEIPLFEGLAEAERERLLADLRRVPVPGDTVLIREGERADALYIVVFGRFDVVKSGNLVAQIGAGEPIGEIAFFSGGVRTASVVASRDSEVLHLSREEFDRIADNHPALHREVTRSLANRLAQATARAAPQSGRPPTTLFLCNAGQMPVPEDFLTGLREALSRYRSVRLLESEAVLEASGAADLSDPAAARYVHAIEASSDILLFLADGSAGSEWNSFALRQCDAALLVASGGKPERHSQIEQTVARSVPARLRRLVVMDGCGAPSDWLQTRGIANHHAIAAPEDYAALARAIAGRARGLVLGGGGALCGGHIALASVLRERGCVFDSFCGASAGGAIAAALALGRDRREMIIGTKDIFLRAGAFRKWTWPRHGLIDSATFDRKLQEHYGFEAIENMRRGLFVIASDLSVNDLRLIQRGPLWEGVRATCSIPALLPPFIDDDGRILLDGGVTDNLPVGPMREVKAGPNLAITLGMPSAKRSTARYGDYPRRRRLLLETVLPFLRKGKRPPRMAPVLARTVLLAANSRVAESAALAELTLRPPIPEGMGILDWDRFEAHEAECYDWAQRYFDTLPDETLAPFRD